MDLFVNALTFIGESNGLDFSNWSKGDFANIGGEDKNRISRIIKTLFILQKNGRNTTD